MASCAHKNETSATSTSNSTKASTDGQEIDHSHDSKEDWHFGQLYFFDCDQEEGGWNLFFVIRRHEEEGQHGSVAFAKCFAVGLFVRR